MPFTDLVKIAYLMVSKWTKLTAPASESECVWWRWKVSSSLPPTMAYPATLVPIPVCSISSSRRVPTIAPSEKDVRTSGNGEERDWAFVCAGK